LERLQRARELIGSAEALEHFMTWRAPDEIICKKAYEL
jgi:hypothetical protein